MRVDVGPWWGTVREGAEALYRALLTAPNRDQHNDFRLWEDCLVGKMVEVAAATALGLPPSVTLDDRAGSPDLTTGRWQVDVKAVKRTSDRVCVRGDVLHKDRLVIVGRRADGTHVDLLGWTHTNALASYPLTTPARGHSKPYVAVPLTALAPLTEAPDGPSTT